MKKEKYCLILQKYKKKGYYEQLYTNKFENLKEMDIFPETYSPPKQNQEVIHNVNRLIPRNEIEYVILKTPYTHLCLYQ